jgi:hypothetical protein
MLLRFRLFIGLLLLLMGPIITTDSSGFLYFPGYLDLFPLLRVVVSTAG